MDRDTPYYVSQDCAILNCAFTNMCDKRLENFKLHRKEKSQWMAVNSWMIYIIKVRRGVSDVILVLYCIFHVMWMWSSRLRLKWTSPNKLYPYKIAWRVVHILENWKKACVQLWRWFVEWYRKVCCLRKLFTGALWLSSIFRCFITKQCVNNPYLTFFIFPLLWYTHFIFIIANVVAREIAEYTQSSLWNFCRLD